MALEERARLRLGLLLPTRNVVTARERGGAAALAGLIGDAELLERVGFDSVWVGDSLLGGPRPEPIAVLAAIAARTRRILVGTAALLPAMRHPLQLAQQLTTLDLIAGGRLIVGVGSGFPNAQTRRELDALNIPYRQRITRCHEAVQWCRALWGAPPPESPRHWRLHGVELEPQPASPGGPHFWLGGASETTCRAVVRGYEGWMPTSPSPRDWERGWRLIGDTAEQHGRESGGIVPAAVLTVAIHEDRTEARHAMARFIEAYYGVPLERARSVVGCIAGTLDEVVDFANGFVRVGVRHLLLRFAAEDQRGEIEQWGAALRAALSEQPADGRGTENRRSPDSDASQGHR